jgi:flagellar hook assembly protein FlgD
MKPNTYLFSVYNRWGEEIFKSKNPSEKWDGNNSKGEPYQDGTYIWKLRFVIFESGEVYEKIGHVNLLK